MANDEDLDLSGNEGEDAKIEGGGGKSKLIIIIAAVVLVAAGAAAFFMMGGSDDKKDQTKSEQVEKSEAPTEATQEPTQKKALFVSIPNGILAQIPSGKSRRRMTTIQLQVDFVLRDEAAKAALIKHMPLVENDLLVFISSSKLEDLESEQGKAKVRAGALKIVQKIMQEKTGKPGVEQVLFTGFIMQ